MAAEAAPPTAAAIVVIVLALCVSVPAVVVADTVAIADAAAAAAAALNAPAAGVAVAGAAALGELKADAPAEALSNAAADALGNSNCEVLAGVLNGGDGKLVDDGVLGGEPLGLPLPVPEPLFSGDADSEVLTEAVCVANAAETRHGRGPLASLMACASGGSAAPASTRVSVAPSAMQPVAAHLLRPVRMGSCHQRRVTVESYAGSEQQPCMKKAHASGELATTLSATSHPEAPLSRYSAAYSPRTSDT